MILGFMKKATVVLSVLAATSVYAQSDIPCPSVDKIQLAAAKIDTAEKFMDNFIAFSRATAFQEGKVFWSVGMKSINATSAEEAIQIAIEAVKNTSTQNEEFARVVQSGLYVCTYDDGNIMAAGGLEPDMIKLHL